MNAVGALQLLSDHESLKSVRDPLLKVRIEFAISRFPTLLLPLPPLCKLTSVAGFSRLEKGFFAFCEKSESVSVHVMFAYLFHVFNFFSADIAPYSTKLQNIH